MKLFYKIDSIITKYNILILLIVVLQSTNIISFAQEKSFENSNFVLDFEMNNYSMDDVKEHFFTTYPHNDPTEGDVVYDRVRWENKDLIQLNNEEGLFLYIKKREADSNFDSFRLTSKSYYNLYSDEHKIMFVFKGKLPSGNSVWPAWWLNGGREAEWLYEAENILMEDSDLDLFSGVGEFYNTSSQVNSTDWPGAGEIDIIENINGQKLIHNTIHACPSMCDSEWNGDGEIINCANAKDGDPNAGCSGAPYEVDSPEGTFVCILAKSSIQFYYWPNFANVRYDGGPLSDNPDYTIWDKKYLKNEVLLRETDAECDDELHQDWQCSTCSESTSCSFVNMKMIFNITLCGKWAGLQFDDSETPLQNCKKFVSEEGREMINNQFMKIEYVAVREI